MKTCYTLCMVFFIALCAVANGQNGRTIYYDKNYAQQAASPDYWHKVVFHENGKNGKGGVVLEIFAGNGQLISRTSYQDYELIKNDTSFVHSPGHIQG